MNRAERSTNAQFFRTGILATLGAVFALALSAAPAIAVPPVPFAESGSGAGQVGFGAGIAVAVDQSTGTVYVADDGNSRIDEFDSAGHFMMAFGWGVLNGAGELQTCTSTCQAGIRGSGPGQMHFPTQVAVDQASHDLYVGNPEEGRIEKFSSSGKFML